MKKIVIISLVVLAFAGLCLAVNAACGGPTFVVNSAQSAVTGLNATPANVFGRMWVYGAGAANNSGSPYAAVSGGAGCANVGATVDPYWDYSGCYAGYGVYADCSQAAVFPTGCPVTGNRMVVLFEDTDGNYALLSRVDSALTWDLDGVATFAATPYPSILSVTRTSAAGVSPVVFDVALTGTPADGNGHFAGADGAPATPIITGYQIYYQNAAAAPTAVFPGAWTAATNGTVSGAATASATSVSAPLPAAGSTMYLALGMTFESNMTASRGSAVYTAFGPTAAPLFSNVSAEPGTAGTTVNWTSGTETQVAGYQVYWSATATGTYRTAGQLVAAQGSGRTYTTNVRILTTLRSYYVKVRANKTDGSFEWSAPVQVIAAPKTTSGGMNQAPTTRR